LLIESFLRFRPSQILKFFGDFLLFGEIFSPRQTFFSACCESLSNCCDRGHGSCQKATEKHQLHFQILTYACTLTNAFSLSPPLSLTHTLFCSRTHKTANSHKHPLLFSHLLSFPSNVRSHYSLSPSISLPLYFSCAHSQSHSLSIENRFSHRSSHTLTRTHAHVAACGFRAPLSSDISVQEQHQSFEKNV